jgi:hypothetical protein
VRPWSLVEVAGPYRKSPGRSKFFFLEGLEILEIDDESKLAV